MFLTMMLNVTMLSSSLLFLLALLPLAATADLEGHPIVGGYTVANRHDAMVKEAAQFAVTSLVAADAPPSYTGFTVKDAEKVKVGIVSAETQVCKVLTRAYNFCVHVPSIINVLRWICKLHRKYSSFWRRDWRRDLMEGDETASYVMHQVIKSSNPGGNFLLNLSYSHTITPRFFLLFFRLIQVVAGLNIRLTVVIRDAKKPHHCQGAFDVDIYNHFGTMSVTKWGKEHTCSEAKKIKKDFKKLRKQKKGSKHAVVEAEDANADKGEIEEDEKENS
jgi:hypothetical protein